MVSRPFGLSWIPAHHIPTVLTVKCFASAPDDPKLHAIYTSIFTIYAADGPLTKCTLNDPHVHNTPPSQLTLIAVTMPCCYTPPFRIQWGCPRRSPPHAFRSTLVTPAPLDLTCARLVPSTRVYARWLALSHEDDRRIAPVNALVSAVQEASLLDTSGIDDTTRIQILLLGIEGAASFIGAVVANTLTARGTRFKTSPPRPSARIYRTVQEHNRPRFPLSAVLNPGRSHLQALEGELGSQACVALRKWWESLAQTRAPQGLAGKLSETIWELSTEFWPQVVFCAFFSATINRPVRFRCTAALVMPPATSVSTLVSLPLDHFSSRPRPGRCLGLAHLDLLPLKSPPCSQSDLPSNQIKSDKVMRLLPPRRQDLFFNVRTPFVNCNTADPAPSTLSPTTSFASTPKILGDCVPHRLSPLFPQPRTRLLQPTPMHFFLASLPPAGFPWRRKPFNNNGSRPPQHGHRDLATATCSFVPLYANNVGASSWNAAVDLGCDRVQPNANSEPEHNTLAATNTWHESKCSPMDSSYCSGDATGSQCRCWRFVQKVGTDNCTCNHPEGYHPVNVPPAAPVVTPSLAAPSITIAPSTSAPTVSSIMNSHLSASAVLRPKHNAVASSSKPKPDSARPVASSSKLTASKAEAHAETSAGMKRKSAHGEGSSGKPPKKVRRTKVPVFHSIDSKIQGRKLRTAFKTPSGAVVAQFEGRGLAVNGIRQTLSFNIDWDAVEMDVWFRSLFTDFFLFMDMFYPLPNLLIRDNKDLTVSPLLADAQEFRRYLGPVPAARRIFLAATQHIPESVWNHKAGWILNAPSVNDEMVVDSDSEDDHYVMEGDESENESWHNPDESPRAPSKKALGKVKAKSFGSEPKLTQSARKILKANSPSPAPSWVSVSNTEDFPMTLAIPPIASTPMVSAAPPPIAPTPVVAATTAAAGISAPQPHPSLTTTATGAVVTVVDSDDDDDDFPMTSRTARTSDYTMYGGFTSKPFMDWGNEFELDPHFWSRPYVPDNDDLDDAAA
ncbi:hypothetical protein DFH06DRAFT_1128676 [Mycena polygramma]|nr:hypothetical protein DFH06DRAFT_1128676 [Mycena polygramma]